MVNVLRAKLTSKSSHKVLAFDGPEALGNDVDNAAKSASAEACREYRSRDRGSCARILELNGFEGFKTNAVAEVQQPPPMTSSHVLASIIVSD